MRKKLLRPDEVASLLNISRSSVYRLVSETHLVGLKVRSSLRITVDSVERYVERQIAALLLETGAEETISPASGSSALFDDDDESCDTASQEAGNSENSQKAETSR